MLFDCLEKRMSEKNLTYCTFEESKVIVWLESNLQRKRCHEHASAYYEVSNGVCHTLKPFSSLNQSEAQERDWTTIKRRTRQISFVRSYKFWKSFGSAKCSGKSPNQIYDWFIYFPAIKFIPIKNTTSVYYFSIELTCNRNLISWFSPVMNLFSAFFQFLLCFFDTDSQDSYG